MAVAVLFASRIAAMQGDEIIASKAFKKLKRHADASLSPVIFCRAEVSSFRHGEVSASLARPGAAISGSNGALPRRAFAAAGDALSAASI
jgi:hypothetical protein